MNLMTILSNNLRNNFIKYLLISFLLIVLINDDLFVFGRGKFPGKVLSEAGENIHKRPGHGKPEHKVIGKPPKNSVADNDLGKVNNVNEIDLKNDKSYEGNNETEKPKSSKNSNTLVLVTIVLLILIAISSIYAWFKRRNRIRNANGNNNYV
ncbi:unnamed protein product [Rhizophagus irregularis]|nr:unnamed protein product [Rhizophagus irregularis]CAB5303193.1 unnamed protein product [Rhizophagus irregularis]